MRKLSQLFMVSSCFFWPCQFSRRARKRRAAELGRYHSRLFDGDCLRLVRLGSGESHGLGR